ncbi:MAG: hypothetical protein COA78_26455 [Blastopirellula sp.]|nr:MAG: hypothetical protein COA78_26455 [Blastopirellula sp.]
MLHRVIISGLLLVVFSSFVNSLQAEEKYEPSRWESTIAKFKAMDKEKFPAKGQILFIGSSSIKGWNLKKSFPKFDTINRGFGGSHVEDSVYYADQIVLPYQPKTIVMYAGDNDINHGYSVERVSADFDKFVAIVHKELPKTKIIFVAIKPSIKRWELVEKMRAANTLVRKTCEADQRLVFLDIDGPSLGKDGKPRKELFKEDGLHLNEKGYKIWNNLLRPHIK